jgi:heme-degrading monooxygenase HmoA
MFLVLWEFEVKPDSEENFERIYGADGDWVRLFRTDPNFRETRLLRDPFRPRRYVTLDLWTSRDAYRAFKESHREAYETLDKKCEGLTLTERLICSFE